MGAGNFLPWYAIFPPQNLIPRFGGNTLKSVSRAFQLGITLQVVGNKNAENLVEREGFETMVLIESTQVTDFTKGTFRQIR